MKGIILAGGTGSRLYPMTKVITKQLQPIYDKPMIYYPLSFLMLGGVKEILLITTPHDQAHFKELLGNGNQLGITIEYIIQDSPKGLPEAFILGEKFINNEDVVLILGDNLFYGDINFYRSAIKAQLEKANGISAHVFAYYVNEPSAYGVVEFDKQTKKIKSIEEKPKVPKSNYAIPGLYLFDSTVSSRSKALKPSARGELEITDLILDYHSEKKLGVEIITRGVAWLDTGTPKFLLEASQYIGAIEERQGLKVACLEEIALRQGFIDEAQFKKVMEDLPNCAYKQYLEKVFSECC